MRHPRIRLAAALLALAMALPATAAGPKIDGKWIRVETEHFVLYSNAPEELTTKIGLNLERLRETLRQMRENMQVNSPIPTNIYVFRNTKSFRRYVRLDNAVVGYFVGHPYGNYVAIDASPDQNPYEIVYHEYIHYFLNNNTVSRLPTWFDEGVAEFYSTFTFLADDNRIVVGRPIARHAEWLLTQRPMSLERLFAVDSDSPDYNEDQKAGLFYAQSWALVHFLYSGQRLEQLARFLELLDEGMPQDDAFGEAFHDTSYAGVLDELLEYVRADRYERTIYTFPDLELSATVEPMEPAEVYYRLGDYLAHFGGQEELAQQHFREALALEPDHAGAVAGLGFLEDVRGNYPAAAEYYRRALELSDTDFMTYFLYGQNLVTRFEETADTTLYPDRPLPEAMTAARRLFRASIELNPGFADAYGSFGATYLYDPADVGEGIAALRKARSLRPHLESFAYAQLILHLKQGEREAAQQLADYLADSDDPELAGLARDALLSDDMNRANAMLSDNRFEEGLELLRSIAERTDDPELRALVASEIAEIEAFLVQNGYIDRYNQAVDLARGGSLDEAAEMLRKLLDEELPADLETAVRQLLAQIE